MKKCQQCLEELPVEEFHKSGYFFPDGTPRRKNICRDCTSARRIAYVDIRGRSHKHIPFGFKSGSIEELFFMRLKATVN